MMFTTPSRSFARHADTSGLGEHGTGARRRSSKTSIGNGVAVDPFVFGLAASEEEGQGGEEADLPTCLHVTILSPDTDVDGPPVKPLSISSSSSSTSGFASCPFPCADAVPFPVSSSNETPYLRLEDRATLSASRYRPLATRTKRPVYMYECVCPQTLPPPITNQYEGKGAIRQFNSSVTRMNQLRHCIVFIASVAPYRDASSTYGWAFMRTRFSAYECHLRCMSYQSGPVSCPFRGWMSMQRSNVPQDDVANDSPSQPIWPSSTIPSASN